MDVEEVEAAADTLGLRLLHGEGDGPGGEKVAEVKDRTGGEAHAVLGHGLVFLEEAGLFMDGVVVAGQGHDGAEAGGFPVGGGPVGDVEQGHAVPQIGGEEGGLGDVEPASGVADAELGLGVPEGFPALGQGGGCGCGGVHGEKWRMTVKKWRSLV